jgi:hypothetical protein
MHLESTIIERVEAFVRHPVFAGSDKTMDLVLEDLEAMVEGGQLHQATYRTLREMILRSPHFASDNSWPPPRAHRHQPRPKFRSYESWEKPKRMSNAWITMKLR